MELSAAQFTLAMAQHTDLRSAATSNYAELCKTEAIELAPFVSQYDTVLDIGAGLGGYWIYMPRPKALDFLDYDKVDSGLNYGMQSGAEAYNSTTESRKLLDTEAPGLLRDQYDALIERPEGPYDIVVSLLSWGYHYPWATYADLAHEILVANGLLILDVRKIAVSSVTADQRFVVKDCLRDSLKSQRLLLQRLPT